jgi:hypothetical protein
MVKLDAATRMEIASTLRRAAEAAILEDEFWRRFRDWTNKGEDPRVMIAWEQADHYWSNFHRKNIFLVRLKPDDGQLQQGREALRLLAKAFEEDWSEQRIEKALQQV